MVRALGPVFTMEHLHLALHFLLTLGLAHCYDTVSGDLCKTTPFFPGYNLAGEGYDIVTLKRKGAYLVDMRTFMTAKGTCHVFNNPLQGNKIQKLPLSAVDLRAFTKCQTTVYQTQQSSVSKVASALTHQDSTDWELGLDLGKFANLEVVGTRSDPYFYASRRLREDKFVFSTHRSSCTVYRYRVSDSPPLSSEFDNDVSRLPSYYNSYTKGRYRRLIDTYGTHYIRESSLGGQLRRLTAVRSCLSSLNGLSSSVAHYCLSLGINVGLGKLHASTNHRKCTNFLENNDVETSYYGNMHLHRTEVVGGNGWMGEFSLLFNDSKGYKTWIQTIKDQPDIIYYSLRVMSDLVPDPTKQSNVKAAIEDYLKENGIRKRYEVPCGTNCCPTESWSGDLTVTIVRAWDLQGDHMGETESYVKMWYGTRYRRTWIINSNYPKWNAHYDLGKVDTHPRLKIEVWDEDLNYDDLLISCTTDPKEGSYILKCYGLGGVEIHYTLTCDEHLTGDYCHKYEASPE